MGGRIALYSASRLLSCAYPGECFPRIGNFTEREQRRKSDIALAENIEHEGVTTFVQYWEKLPLFVSHTYQPGSKRPCGDNA